MKRLIFVLVMLFAGNAFAEGTFVQSDFKAIRNKIVIELTYVGDSSTGSVPVYNLENADLLEYFLYRVVTDPGATAPTANYDITISDAYGDVTNGALANRSATATEIYETVIPFNSDPSKTEKWVIALTNNSEASATGKIELTFVK